MIPPKLFLPDYFNIFLCDNTHNRIKKMRQLFYNPLQIVTVDTKAKNFKRGRDLGELNILENFSIVVEDGIIKDFVKEKASNVFFDDVINLHGKIVLPGLIECHTHTAFAGSRASEFKLRLNGASYEEIAEAGGGIANTVNATRKASKEELKQLMKKRVKHFISQGITTLEIKSGYGLSFEDEIKILEAIKELNEEVPIDLISTFLGAHTIPPEFKGNREEYISLINKKLLPYIAENDLANYCDAFCEKTAFSASEVNSIFANASEHGLKLRLHTEQFNNIGGLETALKHNALSVDHLEVAAENDIPRLAESETVAVLLPGVSFFLDYDFAPARDLIDSGAIVALATDYNPGSSNISNLHFILSLASLKMKMSIEETISAVTINAAKAMDLQENIGSLEIGKKADFAVFDIPEYSEISYNIGQNLNSMTIKNGNVIFRRQ